MTEHAYPPVRCTMESIGAVVTAKDDSPEALSLKIEMDRAITNYLRNFVATTKNDEGKNVCFHCGGVFAEGMFSFIADALDQVTLEWGIAHGIAHCTGKNCRYPYVVYHSIKNEREEEIATMRNISLAVFPEES